MLGRRGASGHFRLRQRFKSLTRLARLIIDEPDGRVRRHRSVRDGTRVVADGLIHEVSIVTFAADGPFEADGLHGPGTDLPIAIGLRRVLRVHGSLVDGSLYGLGRRSRLVEDARDGRKRMIGRVAFGQYSASTQVLSQHRSASLIPPRSDKTTPFSQIGAEFCPVMPGLKVSFASDEASVPLFRPAISLLHLVVTLRLPL